MQNVLALNMSVVVFLSFSYYCCLICKKNSSSLRLLPSHLKALVNLNGRETKTDKTKMIHQMETKMDM